MDGAAFQRVGDKSFRRVLDTKYICVFSIEVVVPFEVGEINVANLKEILRARDGPGGRDGDG